MKAGIRFAVIVLGEVLELRDGALWYFGHASFLASEIGYFFEFGCHVHVFGLIGGFGFFLGRGSGRRCRSRSRGRGWLILIALLVLIIGDR